MSNKPSEGGDENATSSEQSRTAEMKAKFQEVMNLAQEVNKLAKVVGDHHLSDSGKFSTLPRLS